MLFNKKQYFINNLDRFYIRICNICFYFNILLYFIIILMTGIMAQNSLSKETISNIFSIGLFFNYKNIKQILEKVIFTCIIYFFLIVIEYNYY